MMRRIAIAAVALLVVAGFAFAAGETKEATGTVKAVSGNSITVTDSAAKDWTFMIEKETNVIAKGGSHKMSKLKADGKPTTIGEFVAEKQQVIVKYSEKEGKMFAKEVRVK